MKINKIASIITQKIDADFLNNENYVSTENLISDFGGVLKATTLPNGLVTKFNPNDILLSNIRPYFKKTWFAKFSGGCSTDVICLRTFDASILPKYLFYLLNTSKFVETFVGSSKGTKMPRGDKSVLLNYEFTLPNIIEQQHIVDTIGSVDNLIENNDLITYKIDYMLGLFFMRNLSTGYTEYKLSEICEIKYGIGLKASDLTSDHNYRVYGSNGIIGSLPTYEFSDYKIALSCRGAASGSMIITEPYSTISSNSLVLSPINGVSLIHLYYSLYELNLSTYATGSAQPQITIENIKNLIVRLPKQLENYTHLLKAKSSINANTEKLKEVKKHLLNNYFS